MATNTAHPTARPDISLRVPNLEQLRDLAAEVPDIIGRLDSGVAAVTDALDRHTDRAAATSATAAVRELRDLAAGALLTADQVVDELEPIITKIRSYPTTSRRPSSTSRSATPPRRCPGSGSTSAGSAPCSTRSTPPSPASPPLPSTTPPPRHSCARSWR